MLNMIANLMFNFGAFGMIVCFMITLVGTMLGGRVA